jgi:hypothetical protein
MLWNAEREDTRERPSQTMGEESAQLYGCEDSIEIFDFVETSCGSSCLTSSHEVQRAMKETIWQPY